MKELELDSLVNSFLLKMSNSEIDGAIETAKKILDNHTIEDIQKNLSPPSRGQTPLTLWAKEFLTETSAEIN